jgi:pimeloyl-ACP methyl ester carboxylesterase
MTEVNGVELCTESFGDPGHPALLLVMGISTSPATAGERSLPSPAERFDAFLASAEVDWSNRQSVIEYLVGYQRMLAGEARPFEEVEWRALVRRDVERARDIVASQNHNELPEGDVPSGPISSIAVPTLVIHGTADPMFPLAHGEALAAEIPDAKLLTLVGGGHGLARADWEPVAQAILAHTAALAPVPFETGRSSED